VRANIAGEIYYGRIEKGKWQMRGFNPGELIKLDSIKGLGRREMIEDVVSRCRQIKLSRGGTVEIRLLSKFLNVKINEDSWNIPLSDLKVGTVGKPRRGLGYITVSVGELILKFKTNGSISFESRKNRREFTKAISVERISTEFKGTFIRLKGEHGNCFEGIITERGVVLKRLPRIYKLKEGPIKLAPRALEIVRREFVRWRKELGDAGEHTLKFYWRYFPELTSRIRRIIPGKSGEGWPKYEGEPDFYAEFVDGDKGPIEVGTTRNFERYLTIGRYNQAEDGIRDHA